MARSAQAESRLLHKQVRQLLLVLVVFGFTSWQVVERGRNPSRAPTRTWIDDLSLAQVSYHARCGPGEESPELIVVVSPEKGPWVRAAAEAYMHDCPNTRVQLQDLTDLEAIGKLEAGEIAPSLWLPSDSMFVDYLEDRWRLEPERPALERGPSLLRTPIVLMMWRDRAEALASLWPSAEASPGFIAELVCPGLAMGAAIVPRVAPSWSRWAADEFAPPRSAPPELPPAQLDAWGPIRIAHTPPQRGSPGSAVLLALAYGYLDALAQRPATSDEFDDALEQLDDEFGEWLRRCAATRDEFSGWPRLLAQHMYQDGPGGEFDGVLIYEHLAFELLRRDEGLRIIYPRSVPVLDHPAVLFADDELEVTQRFTNHLASDAMQLHAFELGLRPGTLDLSPLDVPIPAQDNPVLAARRFGAVIALDEIGPDSEAPPRLRRDSLRELFERYSSATGTF